MISCLRPQKVWFFKIDFEKSSPWTAALPSSFRKTLKLKLQVGFYLCFRTGKTTDGPSFSACSFTWPTHRGGTPPPTRGFPTQHNRQRQGRSTYAIGVGELYNCPTFRLQKVTFINKPRDGTFMAGGDIFVGEQKTLGIKCCRVGNFT